MDLIRRHASVLSLVVMVALALVVGFGVTPAFAQFEAPDLDTSDYMAVAAAVLAFVAVVFGIKKAIRLLS